MAGNFYESDRALVEYLLFHYGAPDELLPEGFPRENILHFPVRCVTECLDVKRIPEKARALDLGCAVGRATFELARWCSSVIGIDYSERFVTIAGHLKKNGSFLFGCIEEGDLTHPCQAVVPPDIDRSRVVFERGDALNLRKDLGRFDVVLMANLIDRLSNPRYCLEKAADLVNPGGHLILTSPYTWSTDYTPRENWLGGFERDGARIRSFNVIKEILSPNFDLATRKDLPFLIREHARKFQLGVSDATVWIRK
ncbi:putative 4-mercaptohistidine N1-methyltransferase [Pedosphaera parvula]|uniref:Methyltransferase type 11 n=1 Tax=Pedosphaera parvula (strain Ellin514) TaxID=320771 RepID=B9XMY1_PEDPL|nr:putative 4-mercaptohistidine N1-methyltransferase [Pedosphaera parvula]EEF58777.1 Methyltransferase type 11 [Pedosphaera parvula Ellin514]